jgi:hypothetical protein
MKKNLFSLILVAVMAAASSFAVDATYVQSEVAIPYTPTTDIAAGDVLVLTNGLVAVANNAISGNKLGSINLRGVYKMAHAAETTYLGQNVYWDADGDQYGNATTGTGAITTTATGNSWCGWAIEASTATDSTVKVMLYPLGNVDATTLTVSGNGTIGGTLGVTGATTVTTLGASGAIVGSSTVAATGYKIGAFTGFTGAVTNLSTLSTNVVYYSGGLVTNAVRNP